MLTKLLPDQVSKFWPVIKYAVEQSLPPATHDHPDKMNRVLAAALTSKIDVWASYTRNGDEKTRFEAIVLTRILYDDASDTKSLLIYCIYGYQIIDKESWTVALESILKYASAKKCAYITAYASSPYIIEMAKRLGADTSYTFITFDIAQINEKFNGLGDHR